MSSQTVNCKIIKIGKNRNGTSKFWCSAHKAVYLGSLNENSRCKNADTLIIQEREKFYLNPEEWKGGVGLWGSLQSIYNTSVYSGHNEEGIHVHARSENDGHKHIDDTFKEVYIKTPTQNLFNIEKYIKLNSEIASAYTASMVMGKSIKYLECSHCKAPHIDSEFFAVTYHKKHMCTSCGKEFMDDEIGISNPIEKVKEIFKDMILNQSINFVERELNINQSDYPAGIEIWGSNPAIIWTAQRPEEAGVHIHVYKEEGSGERIIDDTYGTVIIDGIELNPVQVRYLMVQNSLNFLTNKVKSIYCPNCNKGHFDKLDMATFAHKNHSCEFCGFEFTTKKKLIGNPMVDILRNLEKNYSSIQKK